MMCTCYAIEKRCQTEFIGPYFQLTAVSTASSRRLWHGEDSVFLRQWLFFIHSSVSGREAHPDGCWENKYCLWRKELTSWKWQHELKLVKYWNSLQTFNCINSPFCFSETAFHPVLFQSSSIHLKSPLALFISTAIPTIFPTLCLLSWSGGFVKLINICLKTWLAQLNSFSSVNTGV